MAYLSCLGLIGLRNHTSNLDPVSALQQLVPRYSLHIMLRCPEKSAKDRALHTTNLSGSRLSQIDIFLSHRVKKHLVIFLPTIP